MRIYWWNNGLHVEPQTDAERDALATLTKSLDLADIGHDVPTGPTSAVDLNHKQAVVNVDVPLEMIAQFDGGVVDAECHRILDGGALRRAAGDSRVREPG